MAKEISNWGNFPKVDQSENSFSTTNQLLAILSSKPKLIARGLGRCYGDASLSNEAMVSTLKFNKILSFDLSEGIMEAQSGISFQAILEFIVPRGWFLPVTPGTKFITLGGAVASDIHGKNHHSEGSFSNHILNLNLINHEGLLINCSKEENQDLFWATCGGMGLTGIINTVKFRLKKIETSYIKKVEVRAKNLEHIMSLFEEYGGFTYSMAWIDCLKGGKGFGRSIMMAGEHAKVFELDSNQRIKPLEVSKKLKLSIPFNFPDFALNPLTVKTFNFLYYHIHPNQKTEKIIPYDPFFYPLDSILHWNRMYGKKGFVQYQFVLPLENSYNGLKTILSKIRNKGMGSFLAVLKLFGSQEGLISFPMKGYTLALDFPIQKGLFSFLNELDEIVLSLGGRIYLTKDARMSAETYWKSYPNATKFSSLLENYNPNAFFESTLSARLSLQKKALTALL